MPTAFPLGAEVTLAALEEDPHPVHARLREREPVSWLPVLGGWLITRRDLALAAMRDPATFTVEDERFTTSASWARACSRPTAPPTSGTARRSWAPSAPPRFASASP